MVAKREAYFHGTAYFRLKHHNQMFVYIQSIHDKPELQRAFGVETPMKKDYVPLNFKYFMITY
jgi:hypothetical protein